MIRRHLEKALYPTLPDRQFVLTWAQDYSEGIMRKVWEAWDCLQADLIDARVNISRELLDLENSLTGELVRRLRDVISDYAPYFVDRESPERETMKEGGGRPPTYDIAFVLRENETFKWPIEAKVLERDSLASMNDYLGNLSEDFLNCRYAPHSAEGAMIGYLLDGD